MKSFTRSLLLIVIVFQFAIGQSQNKYADSENLAGTEKEQALITRIDTYLNNSVVNGYSGSVLVAKGGNIILSKGYGWSHKAENINNTPSTVFNIGSVTKQFTAAAILKLVEQGKLKTTDSIGSFYQQAPEDKQSITIHQLLTHTTGISQQTGGFRYDAASKEQFLKEFFQAELLWEPGTKHRYANANYIMLTAIIELVAKQDYSTFLYKNFWNPLGMHSTGYKDIAFNRDRLAHGYYFHYNDGVWKDWGTTQDHLPTDDVHWYSIGKGDLYSTVEDLYKWHLALKTSKVLSPKSLEMFETPYVAENEEGTSYYGYGWAIFKSKRDTKIVTHNGSNGIYFANFIRFVEDDVVVIELANTILGNETFNVSWNIGNMTFDETYIAKPLPKNVFELVYDFIKTNTLEEITMLPGFLKENLRTKHIDKAIFNRMGYALLKKEASPAWGLELLKLNVQLFPGDGNLWDSLGDAYFTYNVKEQAVYSYKKALELKPEENCH